MIREMIFVPFSLIVLLGCASHHVGKSTLHNSPIVSPQHEVLVLGSVHLSAYDSRIAQNLPRLRQLLRGWSPTKIAVEDRKPEMIHRASVYSKFDPRYKKLLEMFDGKDVAWAQKIAQKNKIEYELALEKIGKAIPKEKNLSDEERIQLIQLLIVSYDVPTAVLQWSKLPLNFREATVNFSKDDKKELDRLLGSQNEIYSLAVSLARELNHPQIHSVDSQDDGVSMLSLPVDALNRFFSDSRGEQFMQSTFFIQEKNLIDETLRNGDLVALYRFINENAKQYEHQWDWLINDNKPSEAQILRYANWEARNLRILSNLQDISTTGVPERILLIVGASHKSILDNYLGQNKSVRLMQFEDLSTGTK